MLTLMWIVIGVLAAVVALLAKIGWNRIEEERKRCDERDKAKHDQTMAFAKVMEEVAKHLKAPSTPVIFSERDTPPHTLPSQRG